jgi:putative endonuclease
MTYYVYILESLTSGFLYKGYTTDYIKRLEQHNNGESRYTSLHRPWKLVYVEICINKTSPLKRESNLKELKNKGNDFNEKAAQMLHEMRWC